MTTDYDVQAQIRDRIRAEKDQKFSATYAGALMLEDLWKRLQPFQRDYDAYIDMGPRNARKSIEIRRDLRQAPIATWHRDGRTLLFTSTGGRAELSSVDDAISVTLHFLETGALPDGTAAPPRIGFLG